MPLGATRPQAVSNSEGDQRHLHLGGGNGVGWWMENSPQPFDRTVMRAQAGGPVVAPSAAAVMVAHKKPKQQQQWQRQWVPHPSSVSTGATIHQPEE